MATEPTKQELEKLIEAQARGETVEEVPTETEKQQEGELDRRVSKIGDGSVHVVGAGGSGTG